MAFMGINTIKGRRDSEAGRLDRQTDLDDLIPLCTIQGPSVGRLKEMPGYGDFPGNWNIRKP